MSDPLSPEELEALRVRCFRSSSEFCRVFLPDWFPTKMPWFHRGILALVSGKTEFLLDFGKEVWRDEVAEWTHADLEKILTNFVVAERPNDPTSPFRPVFELDVSGERPTLKIVSPTSKIAVILPRGYSKTTLMNAANLKGVVYKETDYFFYVSEAGSHARDQLMTIRKELEDNDLLRLAFGDMVPARNDSNKWGEDIIEPLGGVILRATGRGGQIRGKAKSAKRPGRIIVDDLEDEESVSNEEQQAKASKWFFGTLEPALRKRGGELFMIGTLLAGSGTILNKLEFNKEYTWIRFGALDRQGEPLWPGGNGMNKEELDAKLASMSAMGERQSFYLEYMSRFVDDQTRVFPEAKMAQVSKGLERFSAISLCVDPAISNNPKADFCAFGVVGMEPSGVKHVIHCEGEKGMDPAAQIDKYFELHFRFLAHLPSEAQRHGVEAIAYQRALAMLIRGEQFRRSRLPVTAGPLAGFAPGPKAYFEVEEIQHGKTGKDERIKGILKPIVHSGYLTFEPGLQLLRDQMLEYPSGKRDLPDVVAMCVKQLDPFAALNLGDAVPSEADTLPPLDADFGRFAS